MMAYVKKVLMLIGMVGLLAACSGSRKHAEVEKELPQHEPPVVVKTQPTKVKPTHRTEPQTKVPEPVAPFMPQVPGNRIAQVNVPGPYVAVTFDDGPHANYTPKVLDILKRHGAKATFFVLGQNAVAHKNILARAVAEGHEIGSHTWDHPSLTKLSHEAIISQMDRTAAVIREATGCAPAVMRPPYGATNKGIIDMLAARYGTPSILWSVDTQDWKHPGVDVVISRVVDRAKNGSIILLHDIHASTLEAVEGVVTGLQARGFKLVTVSELISMGRRAAQNVTLPPAPAHSEGAMLVGTAAQSAPAAAPQQEPAEEQRVEYAPEAETLNSLPPAPEGAPAEEPAPSPEPETEGTPEN